MADIWSIVLGGGLTMIGGAVSPLLQHWQKRGDDTKARNTLMREKAEEALRLIAELRATTEARTLKVFASYPDPSEDYDYTFNKVSAICLLYFPKTEKIFDKFRERYAASLDKSNIPNEPIETAKRRYASKLSDHMVKLCWSLEQQIISDMRLYLKSMYQ